MILPMAKFKVRLIDIPKLKPEKEGDELKDLGSFTVGKRYHVYSIFDSGQGFTDFLVTDDRGLFHWINMSLFRK